MSEIKQGQIWRVITDGFACNDSHRYLRNADKAVDPEFKARKLILEKGEYIEIRYPFEWHFRTRDGLYLQASSEDILNNCRYVGKIFENINWRNQNKLDGILRERLYDEAPVSSSGQEREG